MNLKLNALKKISRIDYQVYQKMGTGKLVQRIENGASSGKGLLFDFLFCLLQIDDKLCSSPSKLFRQIIR